MTVKLSASLAPGGGDGLNIVQVPTKAQPLSSPICILRNYTDLFWQRFQKTVFKNKSLEGATAIYLLYKSKSFQICFIFSIVVQNSLQENLKISLLFSMKNLLLEHLLKKAIFYQKSANVFSKLFSIQKNEKTIFKNHFLSHHAVLFLTCKLYFEKYMLPAMDGEDFRFKGQPFIEGSLEDSSNCDLTKSIYTGENIKLQDIPVLLKRLSTRTAVLDRLRYRSNIESPHLPESSLGEDQLQ